MLDTGSTRGWKGRWHRSGEQEGSRTGRIKPSAVVSIKEEYLNLHVPRIHLDTRGELRTQAKIKFPEQGPELGCES